MKRSISLLVLLASCLCGQSSGGAWYTVTKTVTVSGAAEVVTIQQPATGSKKAYPASVYVNCSVDCTFKLERDGTAATTTSVTPVPVRAGMPAAVATGFVDSNVGAGTVMGEYFVPAKGFLVVGFTAAGMLSDGTARNYSVRTNAISGDVKITFSFQEEAR